MNTDDAQAAVYFCGDDCWGGLGHHRPCCARSRPDTEPDCGVRWRRFRCRECGAWITLVAPPSRATGLPRTASMTYEMLDLIAAHAKGCRAAVTT